MRKNYITILGLLLSFSLTNCESDKKTAATDSDSVETNARGTGIPGEENLVKIVAPNGDTMFKNNEGQVIRTISKTGQVTQIQLPETPDVKPGATPKELPYYITGTLVDGAGANITLDRLTLSSVKPLFVQPANKNGDFDFDGTATEPQLMQFRLPAGNIHFIVKPGDTLNFQMHLQNRETYSVIGSPESWHIKEMYEILDRANAKKYAYEDRLKAAFSNKKLYEELFLGRGAFYSSIDDIKFAELKKFITKIGNSFTALLATLYLKPEKDFDFMAAVDKRFSTIYPESEFYQELHKKVVAFAPVSVGNVAPNIISQTPEGGSFSLSSLRGKYVLVDFWASWCAPCREENPNVKRLYEKFKNKNFEIVGVSLDTKPGDWKRAIQEDKLNWIQVADLKDFNSPAAQLYMVTSIPATYLLDKEGKIIAKNLRGRELENKLAQILK